MRRAAQRVVGAWVIALAIVCLSPIGDRLLARLEVTREIRDVRAALDDRDATTDTPSLATTSVLRLRPVEPVLATWGSIGGCGVGGGAASGGGFKWVGRGVTGGLIDLQSVATESAANNGDLQLGITSRIGTRFGEKWILGVNVPFFYNTGDVAVFGEVKRAKLPGFGDVALDIGRRFGDTNASSLTLILGTPTGSYDAVREGVVLPRSQQLGAGVLTGALTFEHTLDRDFGPVLLGTSLSCGGVENSIGDLRASSGSLYGYLGYVIGPLVPSAGLTLTGKFFGDRERGDRVPDQGMVLVTGTLGLEWSIDYVALQLSGSLVLSENGMESGNVGLGVQTSVF